MSKENRTLLDPQSWPKRVLHSWLLRWSVLVATVGLSIVAFLSAAGGGYQQAGQLASIVAALATVLLVSLTSQYSEQTKKLVQESRNDRQQRKKERKSDRSRKVSSLRRALYEEIGKVEYFEDLAKEYEVGTSAIGIATASTIYESNAAKIGLLTDEEIDHIVEYYTRLDRVAEYINHQRKMDTMVEKGPVEEWFKATKVLQNSLVNRLTFGYFGSFPAKAREEMVREQIEKLAISQEAALNAIEENLGDFENDNVREE